MMESRITALNFNYTDVTQTEQPLSSTSLIQPTQNITAVIASYLCFSLAHKENQSIKKCNSSLLLFLCNFIS